ncbi:MAG: T9SS type A sorting domain-containing protein [Bacteroidia bacterium]
MKLRLLILLFILAANGVLHAQITIQSTHMPKANDTFRFVTGNPVNYIGQVAQNGPGQFWVFDQESPKITSVVAYKSSLNTPYAFYFFNTVGLKVADSLGLAQFKMEDVYQFYSNSAASYRIEGLGFKISLTPLPLAGNYQIEDKVYFFPLEYGNRDSSAFKVNISIPLIGTYSQSGYRITEVVGYGNVVVVDDTLECLKVRSEIVGADTIETSFSKFGFPTRRIEYKWLTLKHRIPVVEVTGTEVAGQFVPNQAKYLDLAPKSGGNPTSAQEAVPASSLVYPNPAQDRLFKSQDVQEIRAFDMQGKERMIDWVENSGTIDWPAGFYLLQITKTDGSRVNLRFVVRD